MRAAAATIFATSLAVDVFAGELPTGSSKVVRCKPRWRIFACSAC